MSSNNGAEEFGDEDIARDPDLYDFVVPPEYSWEKLREQSTNVDEFINEALAKIEDANPEKLEGVFRADYVKAEALDDGKLRRLVEHLSIYSQNARSIPPDIPGEAYMDLVRHFAQEEGRESGEFFTPPKIVALMVRLLAPSRMATRSTNPTCGSAGMLVEAARYSEMSRTAKMRMIPLASRSPGRSSTQTSRLSSR